jgi:hypothetical protein
MGTVAAIHLVQRRDPAVDTVEAVPDSPLETYDRLLQALDQLLGEVLLPARDRERFVGEVLANMAELRWRQHVGELLSVTAAMPGIAVIVRWARRRRA